MLTTKARFPAAALLYAAAFLFLHGCVVADQSNHPDTVQYTAIAKRVKGHVRYAKTYDDESKPLKKHTRLVAGATIKTDADSMVDLTLEDSIGVVRVQADTELRIPQMERAATARPADFETTLELKCGLILGRVKALSANSKFEIRFPKSIAAFRDSTTDFAFTVRQKANFDFGVSLTCVKGTVIFVFPTGPIAGQVPTLTLHDGQSFDFDLKTIQPTPPDLLAEYERQIKEAVR